jgi:hypothetical protein
MQDLETAKQMLYAKELTLAIVKKGHVLFQTDSHRISGFILAIDTLGTQLNGASLADRVAGKALGLLCVYAGIREVYAEVMSKKAEALFQENHIAYECRQLVNIVLDLNKTDVCPFEKAAAGISVPTEAFGAFKALLEKMKPCR